MPITNFELKKANKKIIKGFKTIFNDLYSLPFWMKAGIIFVSAFILWNNFFDLNHFIDKKNHPSIWTFVNHRIYPVWKQVFLILTGIASIANIISIILLAYGKISNYFWGIIGVTSYGLYALAWNYLGDMQLNLLIFLPLQFVGYYSWKNHYDEENDIIIHKINIRKWLIVIYALLLLTTVFYFEIPEISQELLGSYAYDGSSVHKVVPHVLDAVTNGFSIVGQILLLLRFREQWIMWIIVNISQFIMYAGVANDKIDINMLILWSIATAYAIVGFYQWYVIKKPYHPIPEKTEPTIRQPMRYYYNEH